MKLTKRQKQLAEQLLLTVINRENVVEYNELANRITPPIHARQVGREIGEVSKLCHKLGLPLLSAKVISRGSRKAGAGFYKLMEGLDIDTKGKTEKELFHQELKKIRECREWYRLADYLQLDLDLPREGRTFKLSNRSWIIPSKVAIYDVISAFEKYSEIDWRQSVNYKIGDVVYIYCAKPYQRIMFQTEVLKMNIPFEDTIGDAEFWIDTQEQELAKGRMYVRLRLLQSIDSDLLELNNLLANGLNVAPQGPRSVPEQLEVYIKAVLERAIFPEELNAAQAETFVEGIKKQIIVNAYERNPVARQKCLEIHGSKCIICNFDFGEYYGESFAGKIHVHHLKPLHSIGDEYKVDPEHDLVPVCPNCHMILHSKQNGVFSVEEVKQMIYRNKGC